MMQQKQGQNKAGTLPYYRNTDTKKLAPFVIWKQKKRKSVFLLRGEGVKAILAQFFITIMFWSKDTFQNNSVLL